MKKLLLFVGGIAGFTALSAQALTPQVIASSGTTFAGPTVSLSYTIGEPLTNSLGAGGTALTQGFHQARFDIVAVEDHMADFDVSVYPVPMDQSVTVECTREDLIQVRMFDAAGRSLLTSEVFSQKLTLDVQKLANGPYMIVVTTASGDPVKTFSVVKTTTH
jgi:hypothetical protein